MTVECIHVVVQGQREVVTGLRHEVGHHNARIVVDVVECPLWFTTDVHRLNALLDTG